MKNLKRILIIFILFVVAIFFLETFKSKLESLQADSGIWILLVVSTLLNIAVVIYHYSIPPHPKFLIIPFRRWTIRLHIWSGTIELISGVFACFLFSPKAALVQATAGLFFHVPTALIQVPIVFGSKAIMVPSYLLCIFIHAYCALNLLINPESHAWAISTFLIFNVYVWCRFYFYFFDRLHLMGDQKYTVSILFAGLTIIPSLFGPLSMILLVAYISLYFFMVWLLLLSTPEDLFAFVHERGRDAILGSKFIQAKVHPEKVKELKNESERDKAEYVFNLISDNQKVIDQSELSGLLYEWGLSKKEVSRYSEVFGKSEIDFDTFLFKMDPIWRFIYFDVLRGINSSEKTEMIARSLEGVKSGKEVKSLKKNIQLNLLENVSFLQNVTPGLIEDLASSLTLRKISANDHVFHEGEIGDRFYLISLGSVAVYKKSELVAELNMGACFGEIALIESSPRNATVIAKIDCEFYTLSKSSFDFVINRHLELKSKIQDFIRSRK